MNVIQYETMAFIFPDNMDDFRKRYGVDVICVDFEQGCLMGLGPNDSDWRHIPAEEHDSGVRVVKFGKKED